MSFSAVDSLPLSSSDCKLYSAPPIREVPFSCEAADIDVGRNTAEVDVDDTRLSS